MSDKEREQDEKEQAEYDAWVGREHPHKFKKLSQALADVEVKQLKTNVPIRDAPREGHKSFMSEEIAQHKDTVGAKHWVEAVAALNDSVQSLELIVLHRETILSILLQQSVPAAKHSIAALLSVLTAFSKDLQADFVPFCPRVFDHLAMLASSFARDAECLEAIFASVSNLLKNIHKHLQSKIPWIFRVSRQLRYHSAHHVRVFAAEAFGFMLRKAPVQKLPKAVAAVVSEGVATSDIERVHGSAQLLAVSVLGPSYTLHSRAEPLLSALFSMTSLKADSRFLIPALQTAIGQRRLAAVIITTLDRLLDHTRRAKGAALLWEVSSAAVSSALAHASHASDVSASNASGPSKSSTAASVSAGSQDAEAVSCDGHPATTRNAPQPASAAAALTHSIATVCHAVEYIRGSRVDDFAPLFRLLSTLMHSPHAWPQAPNTSAPRITPDVATGAGQVLLPTLVLTQSDSTAGSLALEGATAPQQVLRFALSIIHAHGKTAGASGGPSALADLSSQHAWGALFAHAAPNDLYAFGTALLQPPTAPEVLGMFSKPLVAALVQCVHASASDSVMMDVPLGLLTEVLSRVVAEGGRVDGVKDRGSEGADSGSATHKLSDVIGNVLEGFLASKDVQQRRTVSDCGSAAAAMAALQCMAQMHVCADDSLRALSLSKAAFDAMISCLSSNNCMHAAQHACGSSSSAADAVLHATGSEGSCSAAHLNAASVLLGATKSLLACALAPRAAAGLSSAPVDTVGIATDLIGQLLASPRSYVLMEGLACVAETLGRVRMREVMPHAQRTALRDALVGNLVGCSRAVRAASLRVILRCELYHNAGGSSEASVVGGSKRIGVALDEPGPASAADTMSHDAAGGAAAVEGDDMHDRDDVSAQQPVGTVFVQGFLDCEERQMDLQGGRAAVAWLKRVTANLEYGQVPAAQLPLVVSCLLGMGYIKYSELRQPLSGALAAVIEYHPKVSWPLFLDFLRPTQSRFLSPTQPPVSSIPPTSPFNPTCIHPDDPPFSLRRLFGAYACAGTPEASGGFSDTSSVLSILLKALTVAPVTCVERMHSSWHDLATGFISSQTHDPLSDGSVEAPPTEASEAETEASRSSGPRAKDWRARLTEWLQLIARLKGTRNFQKARDWPFIITPHLSSIDPQVQRSALDALATLRQPPALSRYLPQITAMTEPKRIKNALTRFSLEAGADNGIADTDRAEILPVVIRLLLPLLRRRTGRRGASDIPAPPTSARPAVLNRLAALEPNELSTLVQLSLEPHRQLFPPQPPSPPASEHGVTAPGAAAGVMLRGMQEAWWHAELACEDAARWLQAVTVDGVAAYPLGRRKAVLNTISDLISHLGFRMQPFLPLLTALVVRILQAACGHTGDRAQRSTSIQLLATVLSRFPVSAAWQPLWPEVLPVLAPLAATLAGDSAAGGKSPSVLTLMHALATTPALLPVLADRQSMHEPPAFLHRVEADAHVERRANVRDARMISMHGDSDEEDNAEKQGHAPADDDLGHGSDDGDMHAGHTLGMNSVNAHNSSNDNTAAPADDMTSDAVNAAVPVCCEAWAQQKCGSNLVAAAVDAFSRPGTTPSVRNSAFLVLEALATVHRAGARMVLAPHTSKLLPALQAQLVRTVEGVSAARCVALLHRLVPLVEDSSDCLAPLSAALATACSSRRGGERRAAAALSALAALWRRCGGHNNSHSNAASNDSAIVPADGQYPASGARSSSAAAAAAAVASAAVQLAPLGAKLETRDARRALADAFSAGCALEPGLAAGARILQQVTSFSTSSLDEADYDARLAGYAVLTVDCWAALPALSASIAMHACFTDLRAPDDLALRSAAASALACMIDSAAAAPAASATAHGGGADVASTPGVSTGVDAAAERCEGSSQVAHENDEGGSTVLQLVASTLYRQLLTLAVADVLVVRQEALSLLRRCAEMLPSTFPDLVALSHADAEADFFFNVAHIQLHRRARAFYRLAVAISATASSTEPSQNVPVEASSTALPQMDSKRGAGKDQRDGGTSTQAGEAGAMHQETQNTAAGGLLSLGTLQGLVVPLISAVVRESRGAATGAGGHGIKKGAADRALNVVDAAVQALHAVASRLAWPQYRNALSRFLNLSGGGGRGSARKGDAADVVQRNALRAVCTIIDAFHFVPPGTRLDTAPLLSTDKLSLAEKVAKAGSGDRGGDQEQQQPPKMGLEHPASGSAAEVSGDPLDADCAPKEAVNPSEEGDAWDTGTPEEEQAAEPQVQEDAEVEEGERGLSDDQGRGRKRLAATAADIQRAIVLRVLPSMLNLMHKDKDTVRAPVALAIVKLLRVLPEASEGLHLTKVLQNVANLLAERLQSTRDGAHSVLIDIVKELGPDYMQPVAAVLSAALPARGFTAHVLGYTLHACLQALVDTGSEAGALDSCLEELLPLMEAGLFTPIAEQKKAAAYASKHRETKSQKAYMTFELLARLSTFSSHVEVLLLPVRERLPDAAAPQTRNVLVRLLQHAAHGVAANAHACSDDVLMFAYRQLKRSAAADDARKALEHSVAYADAAPSVDASKASSAPGQPQRNEQELWQPNEEIITEFALSVLSQWVRKGKLDVANDAHTRSRISPLLPKLAAGVGLRSSACAQLCLKCLAGLVPAGLPGMASAAEQASKPLWKILSNRQRLDSLLSQDCLKLVAALLRGCSEWGPPGAHLRALVGGAYADITTASAALLGVLRAVLARKLVEVVEVYDVMKRIQEQLVKSPDATMRSTCAAALLQFLLDWPLQDHRLTQHLEFVLGNLSFELEDGRLQVLEFVEAMINKFPAEAVDSRFAVFFVPLAQRLHPEVSPACRRRLDGTISALLQRCTAGSRGVAVEWCCQWLKSGDGRMRTVSAQVVGMIAAVEGKAFPKRLPALKPIVLEKLQAACLVQSVVAGDDDEGARSAPGWREAYFLVLLVDKVFAAAPKCLLITDNDEGIQNEKMWRAVLSLLSHRHFWVQKAACRAFSAALAHPPLAAPLMALPQLPARAALELFSHFEACDADAGAATQAVKCMVAISNAVYDCEVRENQGTLAQLGDLKEKRRRLNEGADGELTQRDTENLDEATQGVASDDAGDGEDSSEEGEDEETEHAEHGDVHDGAAGKSAARMRAVTLRGLFKRVGKYAADRRESVHVLRIGALQWLAAVARRLGGSKLTAHGSVLLIAIARPLFQIQEGVGLDGEQVTEWNAQVAQVLREEVGAEALAAAMNTARGTISAAKAKRKRAVALQAVVDPEAAAQRRLKRNEKRAGERKRKAVLEKRQRDAGVARGGSRGGTEAGSAARGNKKHRRER